MMVVQKLKSFLTKSGVALLLATCLLLLYLPVWQINYFHHDDLLFWLKNGMFGSFGLLELMISSGRFLSGLFLSVVGWGINSISDLKVLRFLDIVGVAIFGAGIFYYLSQIIKDRLKCLLAVLILCSLPCFASVITLASHAPVVVTWLMVLAAAILPINSWKNYRAWVALLLCVMALFIYPSSAMMYWPCIFLVTSLGRDQSIRNKIIIGLAAIAIYGVATMLINIFCFGGLSHDVNHNPNQLCNDVVGKLQWFMQEPMGVVFRGWQILPVGSWPWMGLFTFVVGFIGFWLFAGVRSALMAVAFIVLSFLPNLIAKENAAFYRCLGPLYTMVFIVVLLGGHFWMRQLLSHKKEWGITAILFCVFAYGSLHISRQVMELRVLPSMKETVYALGVMSAQATDRYDHFLIQQRRFEKDKTLYDEWGTLSSDFRHNLLGFMLCASAEVKRREVFAYAMSRSIEGRGTYFVAQTWVDLINRKLRPTGGARYKDFMKKNASDPRNVHYGRFGDKLYLRFITTPRHLEGPAVVLNIRDVA